MWAISIASRAKGQGYQYKTRLCETIPISARPSALRRPVIDVRANSCHSAPIETRAASDSRPAPYGPKAISYQSHGRGINHQENWARRRVEVSAWTHRMTKQRREGEANDPQGQRPPRGSREDRSHTIEGARVKGTPTEWLPLPSHYVGASTR
jgi:hypothetical protein